MSPYELKDGVGWPYLLYSGWPYLLASGWPYLLWVEEEGPKIDVFSGTAYLAAIVDALFPL